MSISIRSNDIGIIIELTYGRDLLDIKLTDDQAMKLKEMIEKAIINKKGIQTFYVE